MATSQAQVIKAITATIDHANEVTASMQKLDKDLLYAGVNEIKNLIEEDPQLEKLFADDLKQLRNNARFISQASGIVKNAKNVSQAGDSMIGSAKRFLSSSK
ncbi:hypothetical protein WOSG25_050300 [Weissella oryzae SG25]|uniref:Uncharacterized protein n=1 Tax=Weissella oryzae (strain DSM 25784 / JCM 18191 / LMG 30913 / SG25) TaxID=1329250 RepID=A0A069CU66_WEIOS|nr:hypothetical protein [Weissella oryzae]GAK30758.1 hypothetical protein WOSG25_050300 [Weissella oryzae SG25]